ncbi:ubiquinol oxidase subunit II [Candidatus Protochlamydia phocaeensis]|uniref:ubiquinol oxidase subunit II n=1 Tax=Candidatus Protochlamydia phocaeensis TaxID=1414722 RepID=UPI0009AE2680|nr:ubiquinol oxidase subunit II [Candidatus Protochlamydia phocaeensis]
MKDKEFQFKLSVILSAVVMLVSTALVLIYSDKIAMLNPKGLIALKERDLIFISIGLMLLVVIPVLLMTPFFAWLYRASKKHNKYEPNWDYSFIAEAVWWGVPCIIIFIIAIITWKTSHELDPFRPIESDKKTLTIQVVALQWKWLFLYPEQNIATVNFLQIPEKTPIKFEITADAPMNSFWIPQLSGQVYAMPGMRTLLHLIADEPGEYRGSSANLSGEGFSGMWFTTHASSEADFERWVHSMQQSADKLDQKGYDQLAKPSKNNPRSSFILADKGLFDQIMMKYMMPMPSK